MNDRWGGQAPVSRPLSGREIAIDARPEILSAMRENAAERHGMTIPDDAVVFRQGGRLSASMPGIYVALKRGGGHLNLEVPNGVALLLGTSE
jgi:hypothetical protein